MEVWGGERVYDSEAVVVLFCAHIFRVDGFTAEGSGGGEDCAVPVGELEASGDCDCGMEDIQGDGVDLELQDIY